MLRSRQLSAAILHHFRFEPCRTRQGNFAAIGNSFVTRNAPSILTASPKAYSEVCGAICHSWHSWQPSEGRPSMVPSDLTLITNS